MFPILGVADVYLPPDLPPYLQHIQLFVLQDVKWLVLQCCSKKPKKQIYGGVEKRHVFFFLF